MGSNRAESVDVITAFLWDGHHILLALRSHSVATFPNHWAGISGYLEGDDPLAWAIVEIAEETGIQREHLTLRSRGAPFEVTDDAGERTFRVHPFLLFVEHPELAKHDSEALRFQWVEMPRMLSGELQPTVPRLYDAFQSVWPPQPVDEALVMNLDAAVDWLRMDRSMGSAKLARATALELNKLIKLLGTDYASHLPALREAAARLRDVRRSMAAPANLMQDILGDLMVADKQDAALQVIDDRLRAFDDMEKKLIERVVHRLKGFKRVMTISYSSTVLEALRLAKDHIRHVIVCEARPLLEGRELAKQLVDTDIEVTLVTDAGAFLAMPAVDCVLIGADAILKGGDAVNKTGSGLLAVAAHYFDKPLIVAASEIKWERSAGSVVTEEQNPTSEVWADAPAGIDVENGYFDRVPAALITELIS